MEATLSSSQVACTYCEEQVLRTASRCPYCQHDLGATTFASVFQTSNSTPKPIVQASTQSKITPFIPGAYCDIKTRKEEITKPFKTVQAKTSPPLIAANVQPQADEFEESKQNVQQSGREPEDLFKVVFSLIALLAGSFFAFFGLILKLFSKNGKLVLEWNADTWPYFLFPALIVVLIGMAFLPQHETE